MEVNPVIHAQESPSRLQRPKTCRSTTRTPTAPADLHAARAGEMSRLLQRILDQKTTGTPRHWGINE
jgi:hypothetical protein